MIYDYNSKRWTTDDGYDLHAGWFVEGEVFGQKFESHIEYSADSTHSAGWYIVELPEQRLDEVHAKLAN